MFSRRFFQKARLDPYYSSVIRNFGLQELAKSGFFDDGTEFSVDMAKVVDPGFMTTPLSKVISRLDNFHKCYQKYPDQVALLLTSGGFCPLHNGHMAMMESARKTLENKGYFVAGGYFCPDHDEYVKKKCGKKAITAAVRIAKAEKMTAQSEWLSVDPWAAVYLDRPVNFTDIVRRMELYLQRHMPQTQSIQVFYVCGADNSEFYKAFIDSGGLVIVPRAGSELNIDPEKIKNSRIYIADEHQANTYSSTNIRNKTGENTEKTSYSDVTIYIRDEGNWAISKWINKFGYQVIEVKNRLHNDLLVLIEKIFQQEYPESKLSVINLSLDSQHEQLGRLIQHTGLKTISLDPCTNADYNIGLSRIFSVSDSLRKSGLFPRPGSEGLESQIARIPQGEYNLVEDDIATGKTINAFLSLLPERVRIKQIIALNQLSTNQSLQTIESAPLDKLADVVDLRDFIVGAEQAGLVAELPNQQTARVPYMLPYVRNTSRMSLPVVAETEFSRKLWELNYRFFMETSDSIKIEDCSDSFQSLASYLGFSIKMKMSDFCKWHIQQLEAGSI